MEKRDKFNIIVNGHNFFSASGWLKYHPIMIDKISIEAALIFGLAVNVEKYVLSHKLKQFKSRDYTIIFENSHIERKLKYSPYQIRKGINLLSEIGFIKILSSDFRNKRVICIDWDVVVAHLIDWSKKQLQRDNNKEDEKEMESMLDEYFEEEEDFSGENF